MDRRRARVPVMVATLVVAVALFLVLARPAAANHDQDPEELWVTVALNAAGGDRLSVTDSTTDVDGPWVGLAADVAVALGLRVGSFKAFEEYDGAYVEPDHKLTEPSERGLSWAVDSGNLQLLAQEEGFKVLILEVCTPRVRQVVNALVTPESSGFDSPGSRCRGWYQLVDDPPIRAVVELSPDRDRYPLAVGRTVGTAAVAFGILGIGATLLRRGPLRRRSAASWVLSVASAVLVAPVGWTAVTMAMWWQGSANDPMLLSRGSISEQVARTMLPGLVFVLPALLPGVLLLTVPGKEKAPPAPPPTWPSPAPQAAAWWPQAWWSGWAAQNPQGRPYPSPPPAPPEPPPGSSGWALPGSGHG